MRAGFFFPGNAYFGEGGGGLVPFRYKTCLVGSPMILGCCQLPVPPLHSFVTRKGLLVEKGRENLKMPTGSRSGLTLSTIDKVNTQSELAKELGCGKFLTLPITAENL
jgi:hypothetical protein